MNEIFIMNMIHLLGFDNLVLLKHFYRHMVPILLIFGYFDCAKTTCIKVVDTFSQSPAYLVVFKLHFLDRFAARFLHRKSVLYSMNKKKKQNVTYNNGKERVQTELCKALFLFSSS